MDNQQHANQQGQLSSHLYKTCRPQHIVRTHHPLPPELRRVVWYDLFYTITSGHNIQTARQNVVNAIKGLYMTMIGTAPAHVDRVAIRTQASSHRGSRVFVVQPAALPSREGHGSAQRPWKWLERAVPRSALAHPLKTKVRTEPGHAAVGSDR